MGVSRLRAKQLGVKSVQITFLPIGTACFLKEKVLVHL